MTGRRFGGRKRFGAIGDGLEERRPLQHLCVQKDRLTSLVDIQVEGEGLWTAFPYNLAERLGGKIWKKRRDLVVSTVREDTGRCREEVCVLGRSTFNVDRAHGDCEREGTAQDRVAERRECLR